MSSGDIYFFAATITFVGLLMYIALGCPSMPDDMNMWGR